MVQLIVGSYEKNQCNVHQIPPGTIGNIGILAKVKYRQSAYRQKSNIGTSLEHRQTELNWPQNQRASQNQKVLKFEEEMLGHPQ